MRGQFRLAFINNNINFIVILKWDPSYYSRFRETSLTLRLLWQSHRLKCFWLDRNKWKGWEQGITLACEVSQDKVSVALLFSWENKEVEKGAWGSKLVAELGLKWGSQTIVWVPRHFSKARMNKIRTVLTCSFRCPGACPHTSLLLPTVSPSQ